jgi:hypothetical protein
MTIDKADFLAWYFSGSDQEQYDLAFQIGQEARENLEERGTFTIDVDDLIAMCGEIYLEELNNKHITEIVNQRIVGAMDTKQKGA